MPDLTEAALRILIVEDDAEVSAALQDLIFERTHGVVVTVQSRSDAYKQMQHPIDLAILDVDVTDGRSQHMAAALQRRAIPFIFVSSSSPDDLPEGLEHAHFIPKPFDEDELRQVVSDAAGHHGQAGATPAAQLHHGQEYSSMSDKHEKISERAYQLWQTQGQPEGRDEDIWLMAQRLVAIDDTTSSGPVSEIDTIHRTLEAPLDAATGLSPVTNPKGGQTPGGGSDLVDQDAGGKQMGTGKGN